MWRVSAKIVPRVLSIEQKERRLSVATNLLQEAQTDQNSMEVIITGEETWVYGYDQKRNVILRSGSSTSLQDRRQRVRCVPEWKSRWSTLLLRFWSDWESPFVARGKETGILGVDSASGQCTEAHSSIGSSFFLKQTMTFLWFSNHYSPVLDTCDFRLFPKLIMTLKG